MRSTSWEAYQKILKNGKLNSKLIEVLHYVFNHPNSNSLECCEYYQARDPKLDEALHTGHSPRYSELVRRGLLYVSGSRYYKSYRRNTYDVTEALPTVGKKVRKTVTKKQAIGIMKVALQDIVDKSSSTIAPYTFQALANCVNDMANIAREALRLTNGEI